MSPAPVMDTAAAEVYESLWQLALEDERYGYALAHLANAIGAMWQKVQDISEDRDGRPGYSQLVDVETSPSWALPWLAQVAGTRVTVGASEDVQRDEIRTKAGKDRGRPASTISKVKATLTGSKLVRVVERSTSAWTYQIIVRPSETPSSAATLAAAMSDKPGGDLLELILSDAPIINEGTRTIDAGTATVDAAVLADIT